MNEWMNEYFHLFIFAPLASFKEPNLKTNVHARVNSGMSGEEKSELLGVEPLATFPSATPSASVFCLFFS